MPKFDAEQIDALVHSALTEFIEDFTKSEWWGKEHDCVNRFVHGFLMPKAGTSPVLTHPTQIGIEVGVAQPKKLFVRGAARKDVVIWPQPWMSCWNSKWEPVNYPIAILEWKVVQPPHKLKCNQHDRDWLSGVAKQRDAFVGYSVTMNRERGCTERLLVTRFFRQEVQEEWLHL